MTAIATQVSPASTPQQAVDALLAADRAFSAAAAAKTNVIDALAPMLAADVLMTMPGGAFAHGPDGVATALRANPDTMTSKAAWTPTAAGISADGTQGFTLGYMTLTHPDASTVLIKYMSYWVKGADGWRVAAYKRARRPEGPTSPDLPASLPAAMIKPDPSRVAAAAASLAAAEKAFSDESQTIGLGPAFAKFGAPAAINIGPESTFLVGNDKIAAFVGTGRPGPSPLRWAPDEKVIVASSGDLGVSIGHIRLNAAQPDGSAAPPIAFFTIWRKINGVWKYVAE